MRLAYNADRRRNTPLPVSAQEYEERKRSRGILFQGEEGIVDLTAEFKANPTRQEIKERLNALIGKAFNTRTAGKLIDILNSGKKKKHIIDSSAYHNTKGNKKKRHNAYVFGIEQLIENAEYTGSAENRKSGKKPNVARYHYFEVPVRIGNHAWIVQLVCEETKKRQTPQTAIISRSSGRRPALQEDDTPSLKNLQVESVEPVHLYDVLEGKMLFQQAYHGSPYGFDSFSTDAIGSGEGMQAFGWGLYFTNNRGIAEGYAKKLAKLRVRYKGEDTETAKRRAQGTRTAEEIEAGGKSTEELTLGFIERMARNKALGLISDYKENIKKQIEFRENSLEGKASPLTETEKRIYRKQIEALRNIDPEQIEILSVPRNLYTVDIPDGDYIKWDGPLTEGQKRKITEQARKEGVTDGRGNPFAYEEAGEWRLNTGSSSSGEIFYRMELQQYFPDDKEKSLFLARAGIKGIDYPAGSLSGGAKGRNFVVFDAADVQVQSRILFQKAQDITAKIDEVIDAGKRKEHDKTEVEIGEVTDVLAENALLHGYDIRGYKHTLDNYFVQHVMKQHGNQKAETARGNIAITEDDIRRIPDILSAPDFIVYGSTARTGNKAITFIKAEAGSTVFVEEIRTGRKKLAGQTIYKTAGTTDASSIKKIPGLTSENGSDMIRIVDVKNELVNGKASLLKQNTASPAFASTYRNPNIAQSGGDVNRNLLFQREASLLGIHNLSADNIRHALKMGGLANPSVAVINTDIPEGFSNFGEITLIAATPLLDKRTGRNAGIFGADIYSPRYPQVDVEVTNRGRWRTAALKTS